MQLIGNTTDWTDDFLRRMTAWCCRELEYPSTGLRARFGNSCRAWGGLAYLGRNRIGVRISPKPESFPTRTHKHRGGLQETIADRIEALVKVTAHEIAHLEAYARGDRSRSRGGGGGSERNTDHRAYGVLRTFRKDRDRLLVEWGAPSIRFAAATAVEKGKADPSAKLIEATERALAVWRRKLKLATTKTKKYQRRLDYYTKKAANRAGGAA